MTVTLTFASFGPEHLDEACALSHQCSWPHRREDWALALRFSRGVVALEDGRVVGTALATPFGTVAAATMIIVDGAMRGRGLGRRLMDEAMSRVDPAEWRLIATEEGRPLYEKLGFQARDRIVQHQGHLVAVPTPEAAPADVFPEGASWARPSDRDALLALDRAAVGCDRGDLIDALVEVGQVAVIRTASRVIAFAARRDFGRGEVVGPVIAPNADHARALVAFLFAGREGAFLRVDTDEDSGLGPLLEAAGLARVGSGLRMSRGAAEPCAGYGTGPARVFALVNQAVG